MNCLRAEPRLSAYLDGELTGQEMLAMREHLRCCASCSSELASLRSTKEVLGSLLMCDPTEEFCLRLRAAVSMPPAPRVEKAPWGHIALVASLAFACGALIYIRLGQAPRASEQLSKSPPVFDVDRDQAFASGADSLSGRAPIVPASFPR